MTNQINSPNFAATFNRSIESFLTLLLQATNLPIATVMAFEEDEIIFQKSVGVKRVLFEKAEGINLHKKGYFKSKVDTFNKALYQKIKIVDPSLKFVEGVFNKRDEVVYCLFLYTIIRNCDYCLQSQNQGVNSF